MSQGMGVGRALIVLGSTLALIGCFLPWLTAGELSGQVVTSNGLTGAGLLVFLAAIGMLVAVLLPYAASSGRSALDRPIVYALLAAVGITGLVIRSVQLWSEDALDLLPPDRAIGLWLAIVGMVLAALGVGELLGQASPRSPLRPKR